MAEEDLKGTDKGLTLLKSTVNHRTIEYPKLEGIHKVHQFQLPVPCRIPKIKVSSHCFLRSERFGAMTNSQAIMIQ